MKKLLPIYFLFFCLGYLGAQSGCTDVQASNYNNGAVINDGSCVYPYATQIFNLKVNTMTVPENSGIEWIDGGIYTFGDSGNPPNFYKIDTVTGSALKTISVSNYPNIDWEDITADSAFVYIGDCGNNNGTRTDLRILKIKKSDFINNTAAVVSVTAQAINFSYTDQTSFASNGSNNYDCESVINIGDSLYIFTKNRGNLQTRVYRMPKTPGTYSLTPYTTYNVNGKLTGADYNPINKEVVLIGYLSGDQNSFIWYLNDFKGTNFFSGNKRRIELGNSAYAWQTEGICFYNETSTHRIFISNESNGLNSAIYVSDLSKIVGLNELQKPLNRLKIYPNPSSDNFQIESDNMILDLEITDLDGKNIFSKKINKNNYMLRSSDLLGTEATCFILILHTESGVVYRKLFLSQQ